MLESANNIQNEILVTDVKSDLTTNGNQKISNLGLFQGELVWKRNTQDAEGFLKFLTIIYTSSYGQWFGSYGFLKLMAAEILLWTTARLSETWVSKPALAPASLTFQ
jgi:hypothetical protein